MLRNFRRTSLEDVPTNNRKKSRFFSMNALHPQSKTQKHTTLEDPCREHSEIAESQSHYEKVGRILGPLVQQVEGFLERFMQIHDCFEIEVHRLSVQQQPQSYGWHCTSTQVLTRHPTPPKSGCVSTQHKIQSEHAMFQKNGQTSIHEYLVQLPNLPPILPDTEEIDEMRRQLYEKRGSDMHFSLMEKRTNNQKRKTAIISQENVKIQTKNIKKNHMSDTSNFTFDYSGDKINLHRFVSRLPAMYTAVNFQSRQGSLTNRVQTIVQTYKKRVSKQLAVDVSKEFLGRGGQRQSKISTVDSTKVSCNSFVQQLRRVLETIEPVQQPQVRQVPNDRRVSHDFLKTRKSLR